MSGGHRDPKSKPSKHHRGGGHRISEDRCHIPTSHHNNHHHSNKTTSSSSSSKSIFEDRISVQHREIQTLLHDNKRLAESHVALKQELALAKQELNRLASAAAAVKAERDAEVKEVYKRSLKVEAEARAFDSVALDLGQACADLERLRLDVKGLMEELDGIKREAERAKNEAPEVITVREEIELVRQEIGSGRAAIELEKKTRSSNFEHSLVIDKNVRFVTHELEKLCAQLASAEKRATTTVAAENQRKYSFA